MRSRTLNIPLNLNSLSRLVVFFLVHLLALASSDVREVLSSFSKGNKAVEQSDYSVN